MRKMSEVTSTDALIAVHQAVVSVLGGFGCDRQRLNGPTKHEDLPTDPNVPTGAEQP